MKFGCAPAVTAFTQRDPEEGKPVSETTELRIAYDEAALYVAARMHDRDPSRIARQLARRDQDAEADAFTVFLDPHHDHVTGAAFRVSAAGVQSDSTIYNDSWTDNSWDAVWESSVKIDETGWSARCAFLLAAALLAIRPVDVRRQRDALHPAQEGRGVAGPRPEDRERPRVTDGTPRWPRRRRSAPHRRADALRRAVPSTSSRRTAIRSTTARARSPAPAPT